MSISRLKDADVPSKILSFNSTLSGIDSKQASVKDEVLSPIFLSQTLKGPFQVRIKYSFVAATIARRVLF